MTFGSLFLAVQGASSPRIGPTESRPRHGKGILKRVRRRNVFADSCISHNYIRVLSRCNPRCSAGLFRWRSHVNEGAHWPRRATRTLQKLHDRCQMLSRCNRVHHAQIAGCTQPSVGSSPDTRSHGNTRGYTALLPSRNQERLPLV